MPYAFATYTFAAAVNKLIHPERQTTHPTRKLHFEKEDETRFPKSLRRLHTRLANYKHGLGNGKGRAARHMMKEILTRTVTMATFLWLTKETVTILSEYRKRSVLTLPYADRIEAKDASGWKIRKKNCNIRLYEQGGNSLEVLCLKIQGTSHRENSH